MLFFSKKINISFEKCLIKFNIIKYYLVKYNKICKDIIKNNKLNNNYK